MSTNLTNANTDALIDALLTEDNRTDDFRALMTDVSDYRPATTDEDTTVDSFAAMQLSCM